MKFTLIEMLVVIGIIGILAAMVMPALGAARAAGQTTDCINNKKQLITSMIAYSTDNDNAMIYRGVKGSGERTYAAVLSGLDDTAKAYLASKLFMCSLNKSELNKTGSGNSASVSGTNATGMLNAVNADTLAANGDATGGWLNSSTKNDSSKKYYSTQGRFAKISGKSVLYYTDRMKAGGSSLLIFADTCKRGSGEFESWWNFTPNGASNSDYYVTLIHGGKTVGAFADGHADSLDAGKLMDCGTEVQQFNDADFNKDKLSK